jgi:PBSX family phage terminase large subunit
VTDPAIIAAPFTATAKQNAAARAWHDPDSRVVVLDGAIRSGKTQAGGRLFLETALERPATYLVARSTYRSLKDSTQKALLFGDGSLPPLIPPEVVDKYEISNERVVLKTGAEILFRSLEEGQIGKLLNLTLAGILIDQIEELDDGEAGERMFDTLLGRLSDPRGLRKLLAIANPAGLTSWQYRRLIDESTRDRSVHRVHFTLRDNAQNLPADYVSQMEETRTTRPSWYRSFILGEWGAFSGQAFPEFDDAVHVVDAFDVPRDWTRWESLDHGVNHDTAWLAWAIDEDGNHIVYDEYVSPGLVSQHAAAIKSRREQWYGEMSQALTTDESWIGARDTGPLAGFTGWGAPREGMAGTGVVCYADPSIRNRTGGQTRFGEPASVLTEYQENGLHFALGNNNRAAGYARLLELLHIEPGRIPPAWASVPDDVGGAPRLFVVGSRCPNTVAQTKSAPIATDGMDVGEAIDGKWESEHGHNMASARYGAMARVAATTLTEKPPETGEELRAARLREIGRDLDDHDDVRERTHEGWVTC